MTLPSQLLRRRFVILASHLSFEQCASWITYRSAVSSLKNA